MQDEIESLCEKYPNVFGMFDSEQVAEFTKEECATLIQSIGAEKSVHGYEAAIHLLLWLL